MKRTISDNNFRAIFWRIVILIYVVVVAIIINLIE